MFFGVGLAAAAAVPPIAAAVGAPARRFGGEAGRLAGENATRNPIRTARTAAALMVGLALVTVVATLGAGLRNSDREALESAVDSDYVVTSKNGFEPFPAAAGDALPAAAGVSLVSDVRSDKAKVFGDETTVNGVAANFGRVFNFHWTQGSDEVLGRLGGDGAVLEEDYAERPRAEGRQPVLDPHALGRSWWASASPGSRRRPRCRRSTPWSPRS